MYQVTHKNEDPVHVMQSIILRHRSVPVMRRVPTKWSTVMGSERFGNPWWAEVIHFLPSGPLQSNTADDEPTIEPLIPAAILAPPVCGSGGQWCGLLCTGTGQWLMHFLTTLLCRRTTTIIGERELLCVQSAACRLIALGSSESLWESSSKFTCRRSYADDRLFFSGWSLLVVWRLLLFPSMMRRRDTTYNSHNGTPWQHHPYMCLLWMDAQSGWGFQQK